MENIKIKFIDANDDENDEYKYEVLTWLRLDFKVQGEPSQGHFWNNKDIIAKEFDEHRAMVALCNGDFVGFMTWHNDNHGDVIKLDFAEVKYPYRKQGIFTKFISALENKFPEACLFTGFVIEQSRSIFRKSSFWQEFSNRHYDHSYHGRFYKIIKSGAAELSELPDGYAIAVYSQVDTENGKRVDAYQVIRNPNQYSKKYFQINFDVDLKLETPVIVPFHYEGYIGIYCDKELITEGKVKYIFDDIYCNGFLILNQLRLADPSLLKGLKRKRLIIEDLEQATSKILKQS